MSFGAADRRGLTPRSRRGPTAGHTPPPRYSRLRVAGCRSRLTSNVRPRKARRSRSTRCHPPRRAGKLFAVESSSRSAIAHTAPPRLVRGFLRPQERRASGSRRAGTGRIPPPRQFARLPRCPAPRGLRIAHRPGPSQHSAHRATPCPCPLARCCAPCRAHAQPTSLACRTRRASQPTRGLRKVCTT